jgi:diamine N-acetyltransferase
LSADASPAVGAVGLPVTSFACRFAAGKQRACPRPQLNTVLGIIPLITLRDITPDNHLDVRSLEVQPHQQDFVATVEKSLADAFVWKDALARAGYENDKPVGFVLIFPFDRDDQRIVNIVRLLVGGEFQGRGIGKELLRETLKWIDTLCPDTVRISTVPENEVALSLYKQMGFVESGMEDGEIVLYLKHTQDA